MLLLGIEVKAGQPIKTDPGAGYIIHLSQASLAESKNKAESVPLYVNANGKKLLLGTLSHQNFPQLSFDLVFDEDFELSHNWKNGSVYFLDMSSDEERSEEEEELPVAAAENGKAKADAKTAKANTGKPDAVKPAAKIAEPSNNKKTEDDEDSEDEDESDEEDDSEDEDESDEMDMDENSDDEEVEDEETPKKVESSKKRPAEAATPVSGKKAKPAPTPQKTDGKKGGQATPHPSKQAGKTPAKSPKSGGQFSCGSCSKSFGSEVGLESHKKAKHGGK
ncbi:hypothetical protein PTKIN_Ptkin03bG0061200 [Pterospermum kingtungense]